MEHDPAEHEPAQHDSQSADGGPHAARPRADHTYAFLTGRAEWIAVGSLVLLAVALRVAFVLGMRASPAFDAPTMDALYHVRWARALASGEVFQPGPFFRAPLYPYFLGALFKLFGTGLLLPRLVQALLGGLTTLLVYLLGRSLFDRRVGWWAALGAATYWVAIYFDGELLIPTLAIPLNLLGLWLTVRLARSPRAWLALAAGASWGLSAIARPNVLLFMPPLALWLLLAAREAGARRWARVLLFTAGVLAPILPVTGYNWIVAGDRVLISSQAGVNLWIGNHPGADGSAAVAPGTRADWWGGYHDTIAQAQAAEGRALSPSEVSRHYARRALAFLLHEPSQSIPLLLRKLRLFWMDWELGNNQEVRFFAFRFSPWLRWTPLRFAFVAAAGLLGIALSWKRRRELFPLWGFLLVYMLSVVAFFINGRYRLPVVPVLLIYSGHTLVWLAEALRARRLGQLAAATAFMALVLTGSRSFPQGLTTDDANGLWQLGLAQEARGDLAAAEARLREALDVRPRHPFARVALGGVLARQGRLDAAIAELERAWRETASVNAIEPVLNAYIEAQRLDDALAFAERSLERHSELAAIHYAVGRVHVLRADWPAAYRALREAERLDRDHALYAWGFATVASSLGLEDECLAGLERAIEALEAHPGRTDPALGERMFQSLIDLLRTGGDLQGVRETEERRDAWRGVVSGSRGDG